MTWVHRFDKLIFQTFKLSRNQIWLFCHIRTINYINVLCFPARLLTKPVKKIHRYPIMYGSFFWLATDGILFRICEIVIIFETGFVHGMCEDSKVYSQFWIDYIFTVVQNTYSLPCVYVCAFDILCCRIENSFNKCCKARQSWATYWRLKVLLCRKFLSSAKWACLQMFALIVTLLYSCS